MSSEIENNISKRRGFVTLSAENREKDIKNSLRNRRKIIEKYIHCQNNIVHYFRNRVPAKGRYFI